MQVASRRCPRQARLQVVSQAAAAPVKELERKAVPTELEDGELPLNTFSPKKPFKAKIKSVERIVGPKATGETCHIIIETDGKIPFWEGQSYGVIPPVRLAPSCSRDHLMVLPAAFLTSSAAHCSGWPSGWPQCCAKPHSRSFARHRPQACCLSSDPKSRLQALRHPHLPAKP